MSPKKIPGNGKDKVDVFTPTPYLGDYITMLCDAVQG